MLTADFFYCLLQHAPLQVTLHALHYLILDFLSFTISVTRYLKLVTLELFHLECAAYSRII
jgi:hypothetical protein